MNLALNRHKNEVKRDGSTLGELDVNLRCFSFVDFKDFIDIVDVVDVVVEGVVVVVVVGVVVVVKVGVLVWSN